MKQKSEFLLVVHWPYWEVDSLTVVVPFLARTHHLETRYRLHHRTSDPNHRLDLVAFFCCV